MLLKLLLYVIAYIDTNAFNIIAMIWPMLFQKENAILLQ